MNYSLFYVQKGTVNLPDDFKEFFIKGMNSQFSQEM
jgi:hypothetical protein